MKKKVTQKEKKKKKTVVIASIIAIVLILGFAFIFVQYSNYKAKVDTYNEAVCDYNVLAEGYVSLIQTTSVENIEGMPTELHYKKELEKSLASFLQIATSGTGIDKMKTDISAETEELVVEYRIADQITNPSAEWIAELLKSNELITETQQVTEDNDPNGFLGADGGYTGCVYFTVASIDSDSIDGADIVAKGTDAGGCVEIYENKEDAMIRCEYLSQFDNTLVYSGSYAIVGTMVIRTSYILSNEEQVELTEKITNDLINLKD